MQNLLNWADRASTVPNRSSNEFSGKNGALPAQTMQYMSQPVRTVTLPFLIWGSTVLSQGQTVGGCLQHARLITVETRTLRVSSRLTTVFDSIPGDSR